jgi:hypothetical protein
MTTEREVGEMLDTKGGDRQNRVDGDSRQGGGSNRLVTDGVLKCKMQLGRQEGGGNQERTHVLLSLTAFFWARSKKQLAAGRRLLIQLRQSPIIGHRPSGIGIIIGVVAWALAVDSWLLIGRAGRPQQPTDVYRNTVGANLAKPTNFGTRRTPSLGPIGSSLDWSLHV